MNDRFNFRIWDKKKHSFYFTSDDGPSKDNLFRMAKEHDFPIMQWTTLTDNIGERIYEGDFVQVYEGTSTSEYEINWCNERLCFVAQHLCESKEQYHIPIFKNPTYNLAIIGNKFEGYKCD